MSKYPDPYDAQWLNAPMGEPNPTAWVGDALTLADLLALDKITCTLQASKPSGRLYMNNGAVIYWGEDETEQELRVYKRALQLARSFNINSIPSMETTSVYRDIFEDGMEAVLSYFKDLSHD